MTNPQSQRQNFRGGSQARWAVRCRRREVNLIHCFSCSGNLPFSWHRKCCREVLPQRRCLERCPFAKL